ncbi:MAG: histidinol-phosphate transaminase [Corynebacteriales bacterium]|nr:histidinol-phosphate transaminase [Mycobacteriales bacterium]
MTSPEQNRGVTRPDLAGVPAYKPGRTPENVSKELGVPHAIKLASNEMPFGPLPGVTEAVVEAVTRLHRYPDMFAVALRAKIAARHGLTQDHVLTGCGSVALCEILALATATHGDEIIFGWRSFEAYPIITTRTGADPIRVPLTSDNRLDVNGMLAAVTPRTRLIFVCTPNNPTGTSITRDELEHLLSEVPDNVLIVLDEAYREFSTDPDTVDGLDYIDRPNVAVVRTFSKAWGLAGARIGYAMASSQLIEAAGKVLTPFSSTLPAQAAAVAALDAEEEMRRRVNIITSERERVHETLTAYLPVPASQANFVWLPLGDRTTEFGHNCERQGIIVRAFDGEGVRVTIGTPHENDAFLKVAEKLL